jgi:hypothetical protein
MEKNYGTKISIDTGRWSLYPRRNLSPA